MIRKHIHGIGRYALLLVENYYRLFRDDEFFLIANDSSQLSQVKGSCSARGILISSPPFSFSEHLELPAALKRIKPDIFHAPSIAVPFTTVVPTIMTIHDMIPFVLEDRRETMNILYRHIVLKRAVQKSRAVILDSEHTRDDVVRLLRPGHDRLHVVPLGVEETFYREIEEDRLLSLKEKHSLQAPFFFSLTSPRKHKNPEGLIRAFSDFTERVKEKVLLVVGGLVSDATRKFADSLPCSDRIRFVHYLTDDELVMVYKMSLAFLFASLYEGFGLPVLEAMAAGTPVITSRATSIPEVGGDAVIYFEPGNSRELTEKMVMIFNDAKLRTDLIEKGRERARHFTWEACARKTYEVYKLASGQGTG
jgi:glycosyltransferase involved in cell wall biosynthesis